MFIYNNIVVYKTDHLITMKYCFTYVLNVDGHDFIKKIDINKYLVSINLPMLINLKSFKMKMYRTIALKFCFILIRPIIHNSFIDQ